MLTIDPQGVWPIRLEHVPGAGELHGNLPSGHETFLVGRDANGDVDC